MIKSITYYCNDCKKTIEFNNGDDEICKCGNIFGTRINDTRKDRHINMRNTWSGQTQVEFSQTTIDQDIAERNSK
jgi:hypothetical protein